MMRFLRRVFGRHGPSIYADEPDNAEYDADTQNMILSSIDLLEHMLSKAGDLNSERTINHFFVGEDENIRRAARFFENSGILIGERQNGGFHIVERGVVSIDWIEQTIPLMFRRAREFELEYDGWDIGQAVAPRDKIISNS